MYFFFAEMPIHILYSFGLLVFILEPSREGDWWLKCPDLIGTGGLTSLLIPHIP